MKLKLETERLIARLPNRGDVENLAKFQVKNKNYLSRFEPPRSSEYYTEDYWAKKVIEFGSLAQNDRQYYYILLRKPENTIVGWINFSNVVRGAFQACHVGYGLGEEFQGNGYMTEGLRCAIEFMFSERNFHRIMANYMPDNKKSARILRQLGFKKEGEAEQYLLLGGQWKNHILTSLINSEWKRPIESEVRFRPKEDRDKEWIAETVRGWGADFIISRQRKMYPQKLPAFIAEEGDGKKVGLITFNIENDECEIVTLDCFEKFQGVGTNLLNLALEEARKTNCRRVWLVTTNDNLDAVRFYYRRGFTMSAVYPKSWNLAREIKPQIPQIGQHAIPVIDEIEFERTV